MKKALLIAGFVLAAATAAHAATVYCPIDKFQMYFTGETKVEMGVLLGKYRDANGHTTWARQ